VSYICGQNSKFSISPGIPTSSPFARAAQALAPREGGLRGIFPIQPGVIENLPRRPLKTVSKIPIVSLPRCGKGHKEKKEEDMNLDIP